MEVERSVNVSAADAADAADEGVFELEMDEETPTGVSGWDGEPKGAVPAAAAGASSPGSSAAPSSSAAGARQPSSLLQTSVSMWSLVAFI